MKSIIYSLRLWREHIDALVQLTTEVRNRVPSHLNIHLAHVIRACIMYCLRRTAYEDPEFINLVLNEKHRRVKV